MNSYVSKLHGITASDTISFQEVFILNLPGSISRYTPFESFNDPHHQFVLSVSGELGSIFNAYGKWIRNNHDYSTETVDEVADTFIYLLIFAMTIRNKEKSTTILNFVEENWNRDAENVASYEELFGIYHETVGKILSLQEPAKCTTEVYGQIFSSIQDIGSYLTGKSWQETIDAFHVRALNWHLDVLNYTPDMWFLGNSHINHAMLVEWLEAREHEGKLAIPSDRIKTFKRFAELQRQVEGN